MNRYRHRMFYEKRGHVNLGNFRYGGSKHSREVQTANIEVKRPMKLQVLLRYRKNIVIAARNMISVLPLWSL
jgi:hypothetical protein